PEGTDEASEYDLDVDQLAALEAAPKTKKQLKRERKDEKKLVRSIQREKDASYRELAEREKRQKKLELTLAHLEMEKNLQKKGTKRKVLDGDNNRPPVYKWKRKRAK
ncbi:hypothetical protein TeGR_g14700, partial [Tetraparma gracilis]